MCLSHGRFLEKVNQKPSPLFLYSTGKSSSFQFRYRRDLDTLQRPISQFAHKKRNFAVEQKNQLQS